MEIKLRSITVLQCIKPYKPYTLAVFELTIFCSVGGDDDHYTTPPGPLSLLFSKSASLEIMRLQKYLGI
jgi:hypothetical protein